MDRIYFAPGLLYQLQEKIAELMPGTDLGRRPGRSIEPGLIYLEEARFVSVLRLIVVVLLRIAGAVDELRSLERTPTDTVREGNEEQVQGMRCETLLVDGEKPAG